MLVSGGVISQSYLKLEVGRSVMAKRCTEPGGSVGLVVFRMEEGSFQSE